MNTRRQLLTLTVAGFVISTVLALISVADTAAFLNFRGETVNWSFIVPWKILDWNACAVFFPLLIIAAQRWPLERPHLLRRLPGHIILLVAVSAGKIALFLPIRSALDSGSTLTLSSALARGLVTETMAFAAVVAVIHAIEFYWRYREREKFALQLQAQLSDAQLRALRSQLNPHFLFNTLNAATTLLHRDPDSADAMLTRLGELLRLTLRSEPEHETTLRDELALLDRYLSIMRVRFADRVVVTCEIDDAIADALVPSFILQPIVENAFEHGVSGLRADGDIRIRARAFDRVLQLTVRDNGRGIRPSDDEDGVGLANTRRRLAELYGKNGSLRLASPAEGGTLVEIRLPLRLAAVVREDALAQV